MARVVGALLLVLVCAGVAHAGPTRKVVIDTDPEGATIYVGDKESGPKCQTTPCTLDLPIGDTTILFIELESFSEAIEQVEVPNKRDSKPMKFHVDLKAAVGTIVINGSPGANIEINDEDKGKAPARIEMPEGSHHVVVTQGGKRLFDDFVQVDANAEATVTPRAGGITKSNPTNPTATPTDATVDKPATPATSKPRGHYVMGSGAFDVGFRKFSYDGNMTKNTLRDETEVGQVLAGPMIELWPTEILGLGVLPGLSLMGRFEFGLNSQPVTGMDIAGTTTTFWQSLEISVRNRFVIADTAAVEVGVGYLRDTYRFNGSPNDVMLVPDADYQSIRVGVRGSLLLDPVEPYLVLENRIVLNGGSLQQRFPLGASANGLHGALGAVAHFGNFAVRLEAAITDYSWTFKPDTGARFIASGGSDRIEDISLSLGYSY
jgi:hypothetical protein